jgi:hypothetical protein
MGFDRSQSSCRQRHHHKARFRSDLSRRVIIGRVICRSSEGGGGGRTGSCLDSATEMVVSGGAIWSSEEGVGM